MTVYREFAIAVLVTAVSIVSASTSFAQTQRHVKHLRASKCNSIGQYVVCPTSKQSHLTSKQIKLLEGILQHK
jgi:hypothetical protein